MRRILIAQLGARRHYAVPRALYRLGVLDTLITDACANVPPWIWLGRVVPERLMGRRIRGLMGRVVTDVPSDRIMGLPMLGMRPSHRQQVGERRTDFWARRNTVFCRAVVRRGFGQADTVYAFNGAALELFREAKQRGMRTVLDQTAAPWRWNSELLRKEMRSWPGWESNPAEVDESGGMAELEEAEWELADSIICGSEFVVDAMSEIGGPVEKCVVVRYPTPVLVDGGPEEREEYPQDGPLRVLFVGTLQLRKGIQYLWRAKQILGDAISVRAVGPSLLSESANARLGELMDLRGARPRSEIPQHLAWADVLVLPTLSEGAANVCFEAQGAGVPVLTTFAAGSTVEHGKDGWLVESRDVESLVEFLQNADRVRDMGKTLDDSPDRIPQRNLEQYGVDLVTAIGDGVGFPPSRVAERL